MQRRNFIVSALAISAVSSVSAGTSLNAQSSSRARTIVIDNKVHLRDAHLQGTPVRAIIDTGARVSTISESLAARLGIEGSGSRRVKTVHGEFRVLMARGLRLEVPDFTYRTGRWAIMPDKYQPGLDCVVSTSDLGAFSLTFSDQTLSYGQKVEGGALMRLLRSPIPVVELTGDGSPLPMVLDTGADLSWIDPSYAQQLLAKPGVSSVSFITADGPVLRALRVPLLLSGDVAFTDVLLRVRQNDLSLKIRGKPVAGLLGTNVMRFYDWSMSEGYREVRRGSPLPGRQEWIGLGIDFRVDTQDPGRVVGLAINGPSAQAGLSIGDRILTLDGTPADPTGDVVMSQMPPCECIETVTVRLIRAGSMQEETVAITTAPMV